jgi:hypothetical protein
MFYTQLAGGEEKGKYLAPKIKIGEAPPRVVH